MSTQKFIFVDSVGGGKSLTVPGDDRPGVWQEIGGGAKTEETRKLEILFRSAPWLRRAVNLLATTGADLPFQIFKWAETGGPSGDAIDDSFQYTNKVGFLPMPRKLFWLLVASRTLTGKGYLWRGRNRTNTTDLRYLLPTSITPRWGNKDKSVALIGWKRKYTADAESKVETEKDVPLEDIFYTWMSDPFVEIGPAEAYPAKSALAAAGVLFDLDAFLSGYFGRGAIKTTILTVPANTKKEAKEELEDWFNRFMSGIRNAFRGKVFNADLITPVVIGEGLAELSDANLTKEKREDIAAALGIPFTKLFSTEARGLGGSSVVQQDDMRFLRETVIPEMQAIFEDFNEQVLHPAGYHIQVNTKAIDVFQEDERERSFALVNLTSSLNSNPEATKLAMNILGYELDKDDAKMLDALVAAKEQARLDMQRRFEQAAQGNGQPDTEAQQQDEEDRRMQLQPRGEPGGAQRALRELGQWQRQALRIGAQRSMTEFVPETLADDLTAFVRAGLGNCRNDKTVKALFDSARHLLEHGAELTPAFLGAFKGGLDAASSADKTRQVFAAARNWESYP